MGANFRLGDLTPMHINIAEIAGRGGIVDSDADFVIVQCTKCRAQFLYDEESLILYFDPEDLSRRVLNIESDSLGACPQCANTEWDFSSCDHETETESGRWGWAVK